MTITKTASYTWTAKVLQEFRRSLINRDFYEIVPSLLSRNVEPGARHSIAVLGKGELPELKVTQDAKGLPESVTVSGEQHYYLPVSHCVEKQIALEHNEQVYCLAPCLRLVMDGENNSGRHLYTFFQIEIEWRCEDLFEVFDRAEEILREVGTNLLNVMPSELTQDPEVKKRLKSLTAEGYPRITFEEAVSRVRKHGETPQEVNAHNANDLTLAEEYELSMQFNSPFWIYDYPEGVRDSLYRRNSHGKYDTYDLILPFGFGELSTGGLRPDSKEEILRQSGLFDKAVNQDYMDFKERSGVQTGGFGIGLERFLRFVANVDNVLDLIQPHDFGPNNTIKPDEIRPETPPQELAEEIPA